MLSPLPVSVARLCPAACSLTPEHTQTATVARFSPSGYYIASGDVAGNVRVWDTTNPSENILKLAARPIAGRVNDVAWDSESKRLIVGGEGKDKFGAALLVDSGSSCGEITGHSKVRNSWLALVGLVPAAQRHSLLSNAPYGR